MSRAIYIGLGIIGVLIVIALALPFFIPTGVYKGQIIKAVRDATGRELTIDGDLDLSFFPPVSISIEDVKFANAAGAESETMAEIGELTVGLKLFPFLFSGDLQITRFVLEDPKIHLEVSPSGKANWEFETTAAGAADAADGAESEVFSLKNVSLDNVRLSGGEITYADRRSGGRQQFSEINMTVSLPSLDGPLGLDGAFLYKGERLDIDANIANPRDFLNRQATDVSLSLDSRLVDAEAKGNIRALDAPNATLPWSGRGTASLDIPSMRELSAWMGEPMEPGGGFGPFEVSGDFTMQTDYIEFANAKLRFDEMTGAGDLALALGRARPKLTGKLGFGKIDLTPYDSDNNGKGRQSPSGRQQEWSNEPIDFSGLKTIDADLVMTAESFTTSTVNMGRSHIDLDIDNGVMTMVVTEMTLYDGTGKLSLMVDARGSRTHIRSNSNLSVIQMQPLLRDALGSALLEGITNVELDVDTRGNSMRSFLGGLNGKGKIHIGKGALYGVDAVKMYRQGAKLFNQLTSPGAGLGGLLENPDALLDLASIDLMSADEKTTDTRTDFTELGLSFVITDGVFKSADMRLLNPLLRVLGDGSTNLVTRGMDFSLVPRGTSGGQEEDNGIAVPVRVRGTWDNPEYGFDFCKLNELYGDRLGDTQALSNVLLSVMEDCPGQSRRSREETIRRGLEGLLDRGRKDDGDEKKDGEAEEEEKDPASRLRDIFGKEKKPEEEEPEDEDEEEEEEDPASKLRDIFRRR